eukprot:scaffold1248_cov122-Isochrysis_galbana.AAC.2
MAGPLTYAQHSRKPRNVGRAVAVLQRECRTAQFIRAGLRGTHGRAPKRGTHHKQHLLDDNPVRRCPAARRLDLQQSKQSVGRENAMRGFSVDGLGEDGRVEALIGCIAANEADDVGRLGLELTGGVGPLHEALD